MGRSVTPVNDHHLHVAQQAARLVGKGSPVLVRRNVASLWRADDVAIRVMASGGTVDIAQVARLASQHGVPTSAPVPDSPLVIDGLEATVWKWIEEIDAPLDWHGLGEIARRLHRIPLDEAKQAGVASRTVASVEGTRIRDRFDLLTDRVPADRLSLLSEQADALLVDVESAESTAKAVLLHGDLNPGNVLCTKDGPVLLDWELARTGPPHWDHVPLLVHIRRFGTDPRRYEQFAKGYGIRFDEDSLTEAMCRLRELTITLGQLRRATFGNDPLDQQEAERRMLSWTSPNEGPQVRWTAR